VKNLLWTRSSSDYRSFTALLDWSGCRWLQVFFARPDYHDGSDDEKADDDDGDDSEVL
jgi:hypothetical protein